MSIEIQDELEQLLEDVIATGSMLRHSSLPAANDNGLSLSAHSVLRLLRQQPGLTVPQLSRERGTSRQNSRVLVDRLAGMGWVEYLANPDHERSERLQLTSTGSRALNAANQAQSARLAELLPHVTEDELRSCSELLGRIRARFGGKKAARTGSVRSARKDRTKFEASAPHTNDPSLVASTEPAPAEASPPEALPFNLL